MWLRSRYLCGFHCPLIQELMDSNDKMDMLSSTSFLLAPLAYYVGWIWAPDIILDARQQFGSPVFREVVIIACWCIWLHRNTIIFYHGTLSLARWRNHFKEELAPVALRAKTSLKLELETLVV